MAKITVGLDENNKVNGRVTMLKPPGGDSHLQDILLPHTDEEDVESLHLSSCRVTQPPGGASSDIFGSDSSSDNGSEHGDVAEIKKKPYRLQSSFALGDEQPQEKPKPRKPSKILNPVTGEVIIVGNAPTEAQTPEELPKPPTPAAPTPVRRVPPGGHSTPLW